MHKQKRHQQILQEPISHPSESKLLKTGWVEIYSVYQVTSIRFPHADDTQIVYHSQRILGDPGAVSQEKKRDESFQSFQAWTKRVFRSCLKTFVAPFLPARLGLRGWTRRAAGTKRRSQVTGQGTGHRSQGTGHRAQGTGHRAQKTQ